MVKRQAGHMSEYANEIPDESEQLDQLEPQRSLVDRGVDDVLDEGYSPPERYSQLIREGEHETLDERLEEEIPEPDPYASDDAGEILDDGEVGEERAGRLVDPNEGIGPDVDADLVGNDVGIDGGAASAEEAAVHMSATASVLSNRNAQAARYRPAVSTDRAVRPRDVGCRRRPPDLLGGVREPVRETGSLPARWARGRVESKVRRLFDPTRYRIVLFDQRGCGQSRPHASESEADLSANTTWHLVADIDRLRMHRGIERWQVLVARGAARWPWRTRKSTVTACGRAGVARIFTLRRSELDFYCNGPAGQLFPERYEMFTRPLGGRSFAGDTISAYHDLLFDLDPGVHGPAGVAWSTGRLPPSPLSRMRA